MRIPPRSAFAGYARQVLEDHDEWDSPHAFMTLHWDGEKLTCGAYVCIMPDVHPDRYPAMMLETARESLRQNPGSPPYGYLLQCEAFAAAEPGPDATDGERRLWEADRVGRTLHERPDAVESAVVYCADIHGRLWTAVKPRKDPGAISESFYPPGQTAVGGQFIRGLLGVCDLTAVAGHKIPPAGFRNPN
jgi:hypothetical protein